MSSTMMSQIALIFIDSFIVFYIAHSLVKLLAKKDKKFTLVLVGLVAAVLLSSHYVLYTNFVKEQNYFEFFGVERAYNSDILNKKLRQTLSLYHPDKNPNSSLELFNRVSTMRNTLSDPHYQKLYDRFGEFKYVEQSKQADYPGTKLQLALSGYVNSISFYSVLFIVSVVMSYGQKFSKYRILSSLVLLGLQAQDLIMLAQVDDAYEGVKQGQRIPKFEVARDFYDDYIPSFSIFERLVLIRYLCVALLTALRLYFDLLKDEVVNIYEDQIDKQLDTIYEKLLKQIEVFKVNPQSPPPQPDEQAKETDPLNKEQPAKVFDIKEFSNNKEDLLKLKELALRHKEEIPKDRFLWLKKLFKFGLFLLFIYSFVSRYLEDDSQDNQNSQQRYQKQQQQQQRYQHHTQFEEDDIQY
ncbi:DnaJ domain protein (macronuclear) [Tetrahymena thermophila SB210]|uniref:DnaJ domain protein n=1 Tax=Tetrahymena thermophila (strain SB210) TaxID=312017 RepID=Q231R1_TETTS|nr:DnaJ domain protein [Tetrahymena thermophila SB210]EAR91241.1 DnaJ domain protein [Tetrahymena thermophila SB210]|eukprot:XP_001011486.1 DnaJ domain protein [Tetrahymena thermophila SB210]